MKNHIKMFCTSENGAITVDWVVLTAAVCGLAIAAIVSIQQGSRSVGFAVEDYLTDTSIKELMDKNG